VRRALAGPAVFALVALACGGGKPEPSPSPSGVGAQVKALEQDMAVMREATAAANDVIRASGDCDAARPLLAAANPRLAEAARQTHTGGGRETLEALRKKVRDVADGCP
jgi:hypothetical protein